VTTYAGIRKLLDGGPGVLLDGAVGSELVRRGVRWRGHGLRTDADAVRALHEEYIAAGADVVRTNTFQLNPRIYRNVFRNPDHMRHIGAPGVGTRAQEFMARAVELARQARDTAGREVAVAGVMSPLEHCYRPDLAPRGKQALEEHAAMADLLAAAGVDFLFLESMNMIAEAQAAAEAAVGTGLPVWVSFVMGPEGGILSGEPLAEGARAVAALGVEAVLVNCAPPEDILAGVEKLRAATRLPVGGFAQIGKFDPPSWKFEFHPRFTGTDEWPPERYAEKAKAWRGAGARIVGGCCGTTPEHIRALRKEMQREVA
jgi:S-methylmethionine-dependent homocysteine/selenocysteine methylase